MKFAGICGIIAIVLTAVSFIASFLFNKSESFLSAILLVIYFCILILGIIFLLGLIRLGKYTSKLLKVSSIIILITLILSLILFIILFIVLKSLAPIQGMAVSPISSQDVNSPSQQLHLDYIQDLRGAGLFPLVIIGLIALLFLVTSVLFSIGLIIAGKQVRFAKLAGILILVNIILSFALFLFVLTNPLALIAISLSSGAGAFSLIIIIAFGILSFLAFLLEILALFNASRKFEI